MKRKEIPFIKKYCKKVYHQENIKGGIFNLFYMSEEEMQNEIGIEKEQINIIENLKEVKDLLKQDIVSKDIPYYFGIEGLDYLEKIEDMDILYDLGLRFTNPVWNHLNRFGSGVKGIEGQGLTKLGEQLIDKLVDKQIGIDVSHANETTFYDIVKRCKNWKIKGKNPIVFASHSNAKAVCNVPRNLTDKQIQEIAGLGGTIGVVSIKRFCDERQEVTDGSRNYRKEYIKQINYIRDLLGGVDSICVATDDMSYYSIEPEYYQNANVYPHDKVAKWLKEDLQKEGYTQKQIEDIFWNNFHTKILARIEK